MCCHRDSCGSLVLAAGAKPTYLRRFKELEKVQQWHAKGHTVIANIAQYPDKRPVVARILRTLLKSSFMFMIRPPNRPSSGRAGCDLEPSASSAAPPPLTVADGAENRWMLGEDDGCFMHGF